MFLFGPIRLVFKLVNLLLTTAIIYLVYSGVQVVIASNAKAAPIRPTTPVSSIVVMLPGPSDTTTSPDVIGRLNEAVSLYRSKLAQNIKLLTVATSTSGAQWNKTLQERAAAMQWLIAQGVPGANIRYNNGTTSFTALVSTARSLRSSNRVVIVTDAINHLWISGAATSSGLNVAAVYPGVGSKKLFVFEPGSFVRQTTGVALGRVIGYGHTTWVNS